MPAQKQGCFYVRIGTEEFYGFDPPPHEQRRLYRPMYGLDADEWIATHGVDGTDRPVLPDGPNGEPVEVAEVDEPVPAPKATAATAPEAPWRNPEDDEED
jgi:hypothetical protein